MLFNSPLYGAFLVGAWIVFWLLRRLRVPRALFLVAASYGFYFYGTWDAARDEPVPLAPVRWAVLCLGVIFIGSTIDYFVGRALGRVKARAARNALLLTSIVYYLGVLAAFKYWNFAADSFASLFSTLGMHVHVTRLRLVLPFGISFFTFETMSYTIDVWRRELPPAESYLDYLLFVCFFPHLVAGPIVRPRQMLPQLAAEPRADAAEQSRGLWRIATGLLKKIVIGDFLAQAIVNRVFATPERFTALEVLLASTRTPCRSTPTSRATATSRSAARPSSATSCRRTSTRRTCRRTCRSSGTAGTSRSARGCATTSTCRSAARAAARWRPTAT